MPIVEVKNILKRYTPDGPNAVDGISFEINHGEIFSLLGPNGAGKTTAISIISTLISPTDGEAWVNGYSILKEPMSVRRQIGVVPQELALYEDLSAQENLRFWGEMQGLSARTLDAEIKEKLNLMELESRAKDRVNTFSGGMKRRLNLAIGLLGNPSLIMLDEPTVAIDPQSRRYILDWIKQLNASGTSILYTTHYMEEAQELSHRIGIIDQGRLIAIGTLDELTQMVGEKESLKLQLYQEGGGKDLADAVKDLPGVHQASADNGTVLIIIDSAEESLAHVVTKAAGLALSIRTIEITEPNLEAVFLHLTGRALRD